MIVSVEKDGNQIASVTTFNPASGSNEIEKNIRNHEFPISIDMIISGLKNAKKDIPSLEGTEVYFRHDDQMYFGDGVEI